MPATARLEVRVHPDQKALLERAADLSQVKVSDFVRRAAEARAEQVVREHDATTRVPAEFFDELLAAFDAPVRTSPALAAAARRANDLVVRS